MAANAFRKGLLAVALATEAAARLLGLEDGLEVAIDPEQGQVTAGNERYDFEFDPFPRACFLQGVDEISMTLARSRAISDYEARAPVASCAVAEEIGSQPFYRGLAHA